MDKELEPDLDRLNKDFNNLSKEDQDAVLDVFGLGKLKGMGNLKISVKKPSLYQRIINLFK